MPSAHDIAAPRISSAAVGVRSRWRMSSPSSSAMPSDAERHPDDLPARQGLVQQQQREQHAPDRHREGEDRRCAPPGSSWRPNSTRPFQPVMLNSASSGDLPPESARNRDGIAGKLRDRQQAERGKGQGQRAKRERRHFGDAHLQHRPVAAPQQRDDGDGDQRARRDLRRGLRLRLRRVRCARFAAAGAHRPLTGRVSPYLLWCSARACVTHASRRMRPGNSGSLASNSSMSRSLQRAIWR